MTIFEIISVVVGSGTLIAIIKSAVLLGKIVQKIDTLCQKIDTIHMIEKHISSIKIDNRSIDMRLTRLEARFDERGYWESRIMGKTGTEGNQ